MKQRTVKTAVEALTWLHNNEHQFAGYEWPRSMPEREQTMENWSRFFYANHHEKIRVPAALLVEVIKYTRPNMRKFFTRPYMLTRAGKALIGA